MFVRPFVLNTGLPLARQRGFVATLVAIIVLLATLIAAAALMMSVNTSNTIAGNMTFRQGLVQESERAYAAVTSGFSFDVPADDVDIPVSGYFASIQPHTVRPDIPDVLAQNPPTSSAIALASSATGNSVHYVIERLCTAPGPPSKSSCLVPLASVIGGSISNQTGDQGNTNFQPGLSVAYRLTVRVDGPRNSIGYMQTMLR